jgi:asparagine N-glycosylation enzyme membrane subunit Stt3
MDQATFAKILIGLVAFGGLLGLVGVWFPEFFKNDVGPKMVWSFVVIGVTVAIATGIMTYLPGAK